MPKFASTDRLPICGSASESVGIFGPTLSTTRAESEWAVDELGLPNPDEPL